ncbi:DUF6300 family protein [Streptomyces violaceus]|uniref:DUF6300 family protein n=1 Tax=Streptomyces violaceus TaxID=1936 RepID=UPI0038B577DA
MCAACDADRPAASAVIAWHRDPDHEQTSPRSLGQQLLLGHLRDRDHAPTHGWARADQQKAPACPPAAPGLTPHGRG